MSEENNDNKSDESDVELRQLENEHRRVKKKLLPLSTKTQQMHGCSSQSALSISMPTPAPSASDMAEKQQRLDLDSSPMKSSHHRHRRHNFLLPWTWNLPQVFYRLFQPHDAPESQRNVRAGDAKIGAKYCDNAIKTSRYNIYTFIPLNLFEQFLRTANIYFLALVFIQTIPTLSAIGPMPKAIALSAVIGITALRQGVDDFLRYRSDQRINKRTTTLVDGQQEEGLKKTPWWKIRVGQIVKLVNNESVPADVLLLSSSDSTGLCYIETSELDGETNLKYRQSLVQTQAMGDNLQQLASFNGEVQCEPPNNHLTRFTGCLEWQGQTFSLNNSNVLLRGCTLRNTEWAFGLVIYTGRHTKLMKNAGKTIFKRTRMEKQSNKYFFGLFGIMLTLLLTSAVSGYFFESGIGRVFKDSYSLWMQIDGISPGLIAVLQCLSYLVLVQQILPIILYTTVELIQIFLSRGYINGDTKMYHTETDTPAQARSTSLNEDLGQIEYIFSDKTGTLTQNVMTFSKCSINGKMYGDARDPSTGKIKPISEENEAKFRVDFSKDEPKYWENSFKFYDKSLLDDVQKNLPEVDEFFLLIALCHTLNAEIEGDDKKLTYKAQSPDEAALVMAARNFGFVFKSRTQSTITLEIHGKEITYQLLNILEFDTSRKRMSVIFVDDTGRRRLFCKGADTAVCSLLKEGQKIVVEPTKAHLHEFACNGLRTLCCAGRDISDEEWAEWVLKYEMAAKSLDDREERICESCVEIEKNLTLIGATAVEDKLQEGVPETIANLTKAGIKIWVLTGDKQETAVNVGQSCNMIRSTTEELIIDAECYPGVEQQLKDALERIERRKSVDKTALLSNRKDSWKGLQMMVMSSRAGNKKTEFALIINGHSLFHALTEQLEDLFLQVACSCRAVICCRVAPLQKGRVVELVRRRRHAMTLAIGDGGNDVNMIKTAHVGVGISGNEGMQAVLSSDFSFAQFRFLQRLLLVHGRWNYLRMSTFLNFFFYKTLAFALCQFWFGIYCGWSGMSVYDQWFITAYTLVYTSSPLLYFTLFEQDVNEYYSQKFPKLYQPGLKGSYFNMVRFFLSKGEGIATSLVAFFMLRLAFSEFNHPTGDPITTSRAAIGVALGTMLVIIVTVRCCIETTYWTLANVWPVCSIVAVFLIQYLIAIVVTKTNKKEYEYYGICYAVWTSPNFWLTCLVSVAICCLPILFVRFLTYTFKPSLLYRVRLLQQIEGKKPTDYHLVSPKNKDNRIGSDKSQLLRGDNNEGYVMKLRKSSCSGERGSLHNEIL